MTVSPGPLTFNYQIAGTNNVTQKNLTINSSGSQLAFSAIASVNPNSGGVQWLSVSPTAAGTPATLTVTVTPGTLPVGTYIGTITLNSASASNPTQNVQVTLNVSAQPLLDLSTNGLNFSYQVGGALPADQTVIPNATSANLNYTIAVSTNNTGNWLTYAANGITPAAVTVSVNPVGLPAGNYSGTITFNALNGGNNPQTVQVSLSVSSNPTLSVNSAALTFNFETGQANPPLQTVSVSSSAGAIGFSVTSSINTTSNGVTWLLLGAPTATTTPARFTVAVSANGMAPGTYTGTIVLNAPGITNPNSVAGCPGTQCISVTLNVSNTALLSVNPPSLTFSPLLGNSPSPQTVTVNSTGEAVTYTVTAAVSSPPGGNWLVVGPPSGPASAWRASSLLRGYHIASPVGRHVQGYHHGTPHHQRES